MFFPFPLPRVTFGVLGIGDTRVTGFTFFLPFFPLGLESGGVAHFAGVAHFCFFDFCLASLGGDFRLEVSEFLVRAIFTVLYPCAPFSSVYFVSIPSRLVRVCNDKETSELSHTDTYSTIQLIKVTLFI